MEQLRWLVADLRKLTGGRPSRWWLMPFSRGCYAVVGYRLRRAMFLASGGMWPFVNAVVSPFFALLEVLSGTEINYRADLGPGFRVLHPALGVVVSAHTVAGPNLTLVGGNCLGRKHRILIGGGVLFGANAVALGPCTIGDRAHVGAGAVVVDDVPADATVVGVPARPIRSRVLD